MKNWLVRIAAVAVVCLVPALASAQAECGPDRPCDEGQRCIEGTCTPCRESFESREARENLQGCG